MAAIHDGLTVTECSNFWNAVNTCRLALGGGTGEPVYSWAARIANLDGSTIGTTTSNAVRNFVAGLYTDGIAYKMVVVNPIAPDNLTAARVPVIWQAGLNVWTNVNYAASNLTVNGLAGTLTTKYLNTSISPLALNNASMRGFTSNSAGINILIHNVPFATNVHDFATTGTAANSIFGIEYPAAGTYNYYAWKFVNSGTDFVSVSAPSTNFATFASGNRTANNAIALYWVTNGVHAVAVSGTGAQTGNVATMTNLVLGAFWNTGANAAQSFSNRRISFVSVNSGLTQTQSSNLYVRVNAMRIALGGGNL